MDSFSFNDLGSKNQKKQLVHIPNVKKKVIKKVKNLVVS